MDTQLKNFINENLDLINENTKESWEEIYHKLKTNDLFGELTGQFTKTILDARINDPASIMGYIPRSYLRESSITDYKTPNNVTSIEGWAFYNCDNLMSVIISNNITSIGPAAFCSCDSLTNVVIPDGVVSIDYNTFRDCSKLTSVMIGDSVASIDDYAFRDCDSLTIVIVPDSVMSIGKEVFGNCKNLKEIKFKGTRKQAITLGIGNKSRKKWRANSSIKKIICIDGIIEL